MTRMVDKTIGIAGIRTSFDAGRRAYSLRRLAAACLTSLGVSLAASVSATAQDPNFDGAPSYIQDPAAAIAALFDDEDQAKLDEPTDESDAASLRESLQSMETRDQLDAIGIPEDPADAAANRSIFQDRRTEIVDGRLVLPPIAALTTDTTEIGNGELPVGFRKGATPPVVSLPESGVERDLAWQWTTRHWAASNTFSHPLYFEDRTLERHGHRRFPHAQPFVSAGRFAAQAFLLPYLSAIDPPCECDYTLGYYRAGNCVPALKQRPPYKRKAAAAQAAGVVVGVAIIP